MDWLKLFALLVAVASIHITAEAAKKKIRIHLPQKVKHIHHHKKIYITNHAAPSQYAPAFMPSAEGAVAVPTNIAMPSVANLLPLNSVDLYDEGQHARIPGISSAGSKVVPLYRARGYYGPNPVESEDQDYDLAPPEADSYVPTAFAEPPAQAAPSNYPPKKMKVIKANEPLRKKPIRKPKPKPKPLVVRGKPIPEEEHPVTTYHEKFYSDLVGQGTIKKVRKPQRVEKIIDGDTEHIHTYSEEYIHKLIYDDGTGKLTGVDPLVGSMSAHPLLRRPPVLTLPSGALGLAVGSYGTPSHLEYSAYNPREVTHDHIFHDHGEIPADVDVSKEALPYPPRVSYNSQGIRIGGADLKGYKNKFGPKYKHKQPLTDYSYYESMYTPFSKPRNPKPTNPTSYFGATTESPLDDFRQLSPFRKEKGGLKTRNVGTALYFGNGKQVSDYRLQANDPPPHAVSSTVVHDYKPNKPLPGLSSRHRPFTRLKDPLLNFKDSSYVSNLDYDADAAPTNLFGTDFKNDQTQFNFPGKRGKKKSVSTQNISFGGKDLQTTIDHIGEASGMLGFHSNPASFFDSATSTPFTLRESSPAHNYYSAMAAKALSNEPSAIAEASNDNFQYVEAPTPSTTASTPVATTTTLPSEEYFEVETTTMLSTEPPQPVVEKRRKRHRSKNRNANANAHNDTRQRHPLAAALDLLDKDRKSDELFKQIQDSASLKYGDRI